MLKHDQATSFMDPFLVHILGSCNCIHIYLHLYFTYLTDARKLFTRQRRKNYLKFGKDLETLFQLWQCGSQFGCISKSSSLLKTLTIHYLLPIWGNKYLLPFNNPLFVTHFITLQYIFQKNQHICISIVGGQKKDIPKGETFLLTMDCSKEPTMFL
uniref:Uncharacterized protein n=1 Tax=Romanomermis culicivorax TaxID=13658 RepID=A0A915IWT4_ROMCU